MVVKTVNKQGFTNLVEENSASFSSSVSVNRTQQQENGKHEQQQSGADTRKIIKSVRFDLSSNVKYANTKYDDQDLEEFGLWHNDVENRQMKSSTMKAVKAAMLWEKQAGKGGTELSFQTVMDRAYRVCCQKRGMDDDSKHGEDEEVNMMSPFPPLLRSQLELWNQIEPNQIGLEKWIIRKIGKDRKIRRAELVDTVHEIQNDSAAARAASRNVKVDQADKAERLREACEVITLPSRMMARFVAETRAATLWD